MTHSSARPGSGPPVRVLSILGQRPAMTGSGVLVSELWTAAKRRGDSQRLICAGYGVDDWTGVFGDEWQMVTCSSPGVDGALPFPVPGMSDAMPYHSVRYSDLRPSEVGQFLSAFRRALAEAAGDFKPDVVHIHHLWVLTALAAEVGVPCCVTVHGTDLQQSVLAPAHRRWVFEGIQSVGHLFCVSSDVADETRRQYPGAADRISVVGNGYNGDVFHLGGSRWRRDGRKIVLCVGKFVAWKGFRYALHAVARLDELCDLVILGSGPTSERERLASDAAQLGCTIELPGHVPAPEVARWMRSADVFVLPSVREPFGLVLLEALACGCRVVAADAGGPKDIVSPELVSAGLASLVKPLSTDDPTDETRYIDDLAAAIRGHLAGPNTKSTRMKIAGTVKGKTWESVYRGIRGTYTRLIDDARAAAGNGGEETLR